MKAGAKAGNNSASMCPTTGNAYDCRPHAYIAKLHEPGPAAAVDWKFRVVPGISYTRLIVIGGGGVRLMVSKVHPAPASTVIVIVTPTVEPGCKNAITLTLEYCETFTRTVARRQLFLQ
jgi:hypothetical protein